jgi:hypothetical protein
VIHFRRWLIAVCVLGAVYLAYAFVAAPLLEPVPPKKVVGTVGITPEPPRPSDERERILALFPEDAWERDDAKIIETAQCTLLIKDYKQTEDGRLELKPCTLIFYAPQAAQAVIPGARPSKGRPIVLRAPQGAILQFDKPLDFARAEFSRLIGGRLPGEITIFSPESKPGANDELLLTTRNLQMDSARAFTPHDVDFQYGESYGRGRDLTLFFKPNEKPGAETTVGGIQTLQLSRIDRLHLDLPGNGLMPSLPGTAAANSTKKAPIEITCRGMFVFDFEQRLAAFDDQVEITRLLPGAVPDKLTCSRLRLYMANSAASKADQGKALAEGLTLPPADDPLHGVAIHKIVATGAPVILEGPSTGLYVKAARLEVMPQQKRIALESGQGLKQVTLRQGPHAFDAVELQYEMSPTGGLGRLWAAGPGRLETLQLVSGESRPLEAKWNKELRIQPQDGLQVISLISQAVVTLNPLGTFIADELHLWMHEQRATPREPVMPYGDLPAHGSAGASPSRRTDADRQPKVQIIPDRLLALRGVEVDSEKLHAKTERLEAWFFKPEEGSAPITPMAPLQPPPARPGTLIGGQPPAAPKPVQKFDVSGQLVQMRIANGGTVNGVEDLTIQGNASIDELQTSQPGQTPIKLRGEAVELRGGTTPDAIVHVVGQPAKISARGLSLQGDAIHLHRGENRVWIDGPGDATFPMPQKIPPAGRPVDPPQFMRVTWQRKMTFDGNTIHLEEDVQARTPTQLVLCGLLDATLTERIDFANPRQDQKPELAELKLDGGVYLENRTLDVAGLQTSFDTLETPNLYINQVTGAMRAVGRGKLLTIRKGNIKFPGADGPLPAGVPPAAGPAGAPPAVGADDNQLTHLLVSFQRGMTGDLNRRTVQFEQNVETIYTKVPDWRDRLTIEMLDQRGLAALGEQGILMTSDAMQVAQMLGPAGSPPAYELHAEGNTRVDGRVFTARAHRISYTSEKDLLVVKGDGRTDAELWYQQKGAATHSYQAAREFWYWPKTGNVKVEDARVIDLQQLGKKDKPRPNRQR